MGDKPTLDDLYIDLEYYQGELRKLSKCIEDTLLEIDALETAQANREFERSRI